MIPVKSLESGPRRSSILKASKQRQPFQTIVNPPPEVTPPKSKRRISFAEKKHVKIFHDSLEQGTVWDSTYEENDSSSHKNTRSVSLNDGSSTLSDIQHLAISLDKENQSVQVSVYQEQSELKIYSENTPNLYDGVTNTEPATSSTNLDLPNILINSSAMPDSQETNPPENNAPSVSFSQAAFQETNYNNETMTFTKILPSVPQNDKENICVNQKERANKTVHDLSIEFTEAVPNCIYSNERHLNIQKDIFVYADTEEQNKTIHDLSIDFTEAIPNCIHSDEKRFEDVQNICSYPETGEPINKTIHDLSIDFTEAVPNRIFSNSRQSSNFQNNERESNFQNDERESNFQNDERESNFQNDMELTLGTEGNVEDSIELYEETKLNEISMEMTTAIPSSALQVSELSMEVATTVPSSSSEMAAAVPSTSLGIVRASTSLKIPDLSMEITSAVPSIPINMNNQSKRMCQNLPDVRNDEDTRFFRNSMEFTAAVPSCFQNQMRPLLDLNNSSMFSRSMEFTRPVSNTQNFTNRGISIVPNRTILPQNEGMEFTNVIERNRLQNKTILSQNEGMEFTNVIERNRLQNKTILSQNEGMEFTNVIERNRLQNKTILSQNEGMEFTNVIERNPLQDKTILSQNEGMEFTNVMERNRLQNKTVLSQNEGMEFTNVIERNIAQNKTILSQNEGMEFTNIIEKHPLQNKIILSQNEGQEFTKEGNQDTGILKDNSTRLLQSSGNSSSTIDQSSTFTELTNKRRKLSDSNVTEPNVEKSLNFQNCSRLDVEQRLRRSDGVSILDTELTAPVVPNPHLEENPFQLGTLSQEVTSNILQIYKEKTFVNDVSISQVFMPSLSPCYLPSSQTKTLEISSLIEKQTFHSRTNLLDYSLANVSQTEKDKHQNVDICSKTKLVNEIETNEPAISSSEDLNKSKQLAGVPQTQISENVNANQSREPVDSNVASTSAENINKSMQFSNVREINNTTNQYLSFEKVNVTNCSLFEKIDSAIQSNKSVIINAASTSSDNVDKSKQLFNISEINKTTGNQCMSFEKMNSGDLSIQKMNSADLPIQKINSANFSIQNMNSADLPIQKINSANFSIQKMNSADLSIQKMNNTDLSIQKLNNTNHCLSCEKMNNTEKYFSFEKTNPNKSVSKSLESTNKSKDNFLIEQEEPPSFLFNLSDVIEKEEEINRIEINNSERLLSNERKRSYEEYKSTQKTHVNEIDKSRSKSLNNEEENIETNIENLLSAKRKRSHEGDLICEKLNSIENKKTEQIPEMRRTFVTGEVNSKCKIPIRLTDAAKRIISRAQKLFTKADTVNDTFSGTVDSTSKFRKKIEMHEKNVNAKRARIVNKRVVQTAQSSTQEGTNKSAEMEFSSINVNNSEFSSSEYEGKQNIVNAENSNAEIQEKHNNSRIEPFNILLDKINSHVKRSDCIWSVRCLQKNMLAFDYISKSLVVVIKISKPSDVTFRDIENIQIKSLIPDASQDLMRMVHDLIIQKISPEVMLETYKLYDDVLPLLENISEEVKIALNFMFDLQKLENLHLMEISTKRVSFVTRTKRMSIILKVALNIKPFDDIGVDDIEVKCLLGNISENVVKQLIVNVKKNSKFLRNFINDVKDYVEIMEESAALSNKSKCKS